MNVKRFPKTAKQLNVLCHICNTRIKKRDTIPPTALKNMNQFHQLRSSLISLTMYVVHGCEAPHQSKPKTAIRYHQLRSSLISLTMYEVHGCEEHTNQNQKLRSSLMFLCNK